MSRDGSHRTGQAKGKGRDRGTRSLKARDGDLQDGLEEGREKVPQDGPGGRPGDGEGGYSHVD